MSHQTEQRTPEWMAARKGRLTGSMVGAALGLAPYQSRDDAFRSLVRSMNDMSSEAVSNIATEYGNANEDLARAAYEMETGNTVEPAGFVPFAKWSGASPDGYVGDNGLVEIKCPFGIRKDANPAFKSIKDQPHYFAQIQWQLLCTGRVWCDFWQWSAHGNKLEQVEYDIEWVNDHMPLLLEFWEAAQSADPADFEGPKRKVIDTPEAERLISTLNHTEERTAKAGLLGDPRTRSPRERCCEQDP